MTEEAMSIIDFSNDINDAEPPEPLPTGDYVATIQKAEVKISQRDTKYCAVSFYIKVEDYPADFPVENAPDGKTIIYRRVGLEDTQQSRYMLRRFCEAIGAPMSAQIDVNDWMGLEAQVTVDHDEYEGVTRENITRVNPA